MTEDYTALTAKLRANLSEHRYIHTLATADTARALAEKYGADPQKAYLAGLLHDCAKDIPFDRQVDMAREYGIAVDEIMLLAPHIIHAPLGAELAVREYGLEDKEIYTAIACHTTGRENMNILDKVLFVADLIEPNRDYIGIDEIRALAYKDFDAALLMSFDKVIAFVLYGKGLLHPATVKARNYLIKESLKGEK